MPEAGEAVRMKRRRHLNAQAWALLAEFYAAIDVVHQDSAEEMQDLLRDAHSGLWVATVGSMPAGCVVLKAGVPEEGSGECKRLYVRPAFRKQGVADRLMEALEQAARASGMPWIYLDTRTEFAASVRLYQRRGYLACPRYNNNSQATLFFRKRL